MKIKVRQRWHKWSKRPWYEITAPDGTSVASPDNLNRRIREVWNVMQGREFWDDGK